MKKNKIKDYRDVPKFIDGLHFERVKLKYCAFTFEQSMVNVAFLRNLAIEWIKDPENFYIEYIGKKRKITAEEWIKNFFKITDEELINYGTN